MKTPKEGEQYRHYKSSGGDDFTYEVVGVATHTETNKELVIYKPLYNNDNSSEKQLYARPLEMFIEMVERDGYAGPRFQKM